MKTLFKKAVISILSWEARMVLKKYKPKIVGVTGSVGKTSTKDAIYTVLSAKFKTRKSQKSFNSEFGVPLTILGLPNGWNNPFIWLLNIIEGFLFFVLPFKYPEWLVLEIGADMPGDIKKITEWVKPDVSVITRFGDVPVHVEFFPSIEDLINEKGHLARALKPDGTLILNNDDKRVIAFGESDLHKKITYGREFGAQVHATDERIAYKKYENSELEFPEGINFKINHAGTSIPAYVHETLGYQHMYPILAATAVGISQGMNLVEISEALENHQSPKGRMRLIAGNRDTLIVDDTYNSSPVAAHAALEALTELKLAGRKIAVLGDMMELGDYSIDEHKKIGEAAAKTVDLFVAVGIRMRGAAEAALDAQMDEMSVMQFDTSVEAAQFLEKIIKPGDIVLIKGSQSMRMERAVEEIMRHPEHAEDLLVRQDKQWIAKK
ncbi:MAG: UDP-N-acetylmuramoyl-tripeptide--D-alanyl-D-alanine ligase [Patescibacteria group bacterium]